MNRPPQLIIIGYTNIDVNITPSYKATLPGGAAYFAAIAASLITRPVGLVTRIGHDFDATFLRSRVAPGGIRTVRTKKTARSTQTYRSNTDLTDRTISIQWGVAPDLNPGDMPEAWLPHAQLIHIATMPPLQQWGFLEFIRKNAPKAIISIDTDIHFLNDQRNRQNVIRNFQSAHLLFANRREYEALSPVISKAPRAVVKKDKDGAVYMEKGKIRAASAAETISVVDPTGAGDIFAGTFLAAQIKGQSVAKALQSATDQATRAITKQGIDHLFVDRR